MIIRKETPEDIWAITQITAAAFRNVPVSNQTEPFIVEAPPASRIYFQRQRLRLAKAEQE